MHGTTCALGLKPCSLHILPLKVVSVPLTTITIQHDRKGSYMYTGQTWGPLNTRLYTMYFSTWFLAVYYGH